MISYRSMAIYSLVLGSMSAPAFAQTTDEQKKDDSEIVVTGTLIRGTEVAGSQTIGVDSASIVQQGALSTNEVLGLVPQISNAFNGRFEADPRGGKTNTINRPNLRALPNLTSASGAATLVLVDGYRITPVGVRESAIDPDIVPAMALEGVDVVTDGGSSLYGADAVSGVINFRTRRKFEGLKVDGNFGFGTTLKHFSQYDASILAGHSWSSGNAWLTAGYSSRDFVRNDETSWANGVRYKADGTTTVTGTQCLAPVGTATKWFKFGAGASSWTSNPAAPGAGPVAIGAACDQVGYSTYLPKQTRINVYGALTQEISDSLGLRVTAYYTKRNTQLHDYPLGFTSAGSTLTSGALVGGVFGDQPAGTLVTVPGGIGFSFGANSAYIDRPSEVGFETWGITPELTAKIGGDWQLRASVHLGRSMNRLRWPEVNGTLAQSYITAGTLNPQNVAAASATVINDILNYETGVDTIQQMFDFRAVADGSVFELPAGAVKLAVGVEYNNPSAKVRLGTDKRGAITSANYIRSERNSKSIFGEVLVPLASFADLSGSLRYDNYSDFGSTTNPNIGLTLKPVEGLKIFGHWNKSFNAPTTLDQLPLGLGRQGGVIYCTTSTSCPRPTDPLGKWGGFGSKSLVLEGPGFGIKPQTASTWAVGFEAKPLDGLRFGGNFYSIDFKNVIGGVDVTITQSYVDFPQYFTFNDGSAAFISKYNELVNTLGNANFVKANIAAADVAVIVDRRTSNLQSAKLEGVDFNLYYDTDVSFGRLSFGLAGTKQTKAILITGTSNSNQLGLNGPSFTATSFLGWSDNGFSSKVTVNYSGKFRDGGLDYLGNPVFVNPFVTANLFLGYDFGKDAGALSGTSLRLSMDNVLNEKPQYIRRPTATSSLTYANWTLGRVIKIGVSKEF